MGRKRRSNFASPQQEASVKLDITRSLRTKIGQALERAKRQTAANSMLDGNVKEEFIQFLVAKYYPLVLLESKTEFNEQEKSEMLNAALEGIGFFRTQIELLERRILGPYLQQNSQEIDSILVKDILKNSVLRENFRKEGEDGHDNELPNTNPPPGFREARELFG